MLVENPTIKKADNVVTKQDDTITIIITIFLVEYFCSASLFLHLKQQHPQKLQQHNIKDVQNNTALNNPHKTP